MLVFAKIKLNFAKNTSGRITGSYGVTVALANSNYAWRDDSTSPLTYTYTIDKIVVTIPTPDTTAIPYDGTEHTFSVAASDYYTSTPVTGTNAGTYTVTASLNDTTNYIWKDDTNAQKSFTFTIAKVTYDLTGIKWNYNGEPFVNNGEEHEVKLVKADGSELPALPAGKITLVYSNNKQAETGNYTAQATFTIVDTTNYEFTTGGTAINETSFVYEQDWSIIDKGTITASVADFSAGFKGDAYTLEASTLTVTAESSTGQTTEFTWYFSKTNDFSAQAASINVTNVNDSGTYYYMVVADNHEPATGSFVVNIKPATPIFELQLSTSSALEGDVVTATIVIKDVKGVVNPNIGYFTSIDYVNESNIVLYNNGNENTAGTADDAVLHTVTVQYKFYRNASTNYVQEWNDELSATVSVLPVAYLGGSSTYYGTIEKALLANTSGTIYVIPGRNPTIRTNCIIKSGVTLCLPYEGTKWGNDASEVQGGQHTYAKDNAFGKSCTSNVKIAEGITLTNEGTLQVGGILTGGNGGYNAGFTYGDHAQITLGDNSKLISGKGTITCYGFITEESKDNGSLVQIGNASGTGTGTIKMPWVMYEHRGGTNTVNLAEVPDSEFYKIGLNAIRGKTTELTGNFKTIPFNRFFMPNVTSTMTVYYGGSVMAAVNMHADGKVNQAEIKVIGNSSEYMIQLSAQNSSVTAKHDVVTQRTKLDIYGDMAVNPMSMILYRETTFSSYTLKIEVEVNTAYVFLPISWLYDITLHKADGQTSASAEFNQDIKILPGGKLTIDSGVNVTADKLIIYDHSWSESGLAASVYETTYGEKGTLILNGSLTVNSISGFIGTNKAGGQLNITTSNTLTAVESLSLGEIRKIDVVITSIEKFSNINYKTINDGVTAYGYLVQNDGTISATSSAFSTNTTYYSTGKAWYTSGTYTATFYGNGGTFANGATSATSTGTNGAALTCPTPTRNGYSLTGWVDGAGNVYSLSDTLIYYGNVTLTAQWTEATYIVTLNANGGKINGSSTTTTSATYNSKYGALPTPTRTGYAFDGWWTAANGGDLIRQDTIVTITSAQTLYAHWTANKYDVTFNYNFGDNPTVATDKIAYNTTYSTVMPDVEVPDGYEFLGWWTAAKGGTQVNASDVYTLTTGQTLYAHWNELMDYVLVTYVDESGETLKTNVKTSLGTAYNHNYLVPGYVVSWSDEYGNAAVPLDATIGSTVTVTATLTPITYTVVYDTDGGSEVAEQIVKYGESFTLPTSTKEGHSLMWSVNGESKAVGAEVSNLTTIANATVTITAEWSINQYTITFNTDGGSTVDAITLDYGTAIKPPANPTKTGHTFNGWSPELPSTMPAENLTITAQWTINSYTITVTTSHATVKVNGTTVNNNGTVSIKYGTQVTVSVSYDRPASQTTTIKGEDKTTYTSPFNMPAQNVTISSSSSLCVAAGTLITMADGTTKLVEDIVIGDQILAFNHETGKFEAGTVYMNAHDNVEWTTYEIINLEFDDGTKLRIINEHVLFDYTLMQYVPINLETMYQYVGHDMATAKFVDGEFVVGTKKLVKAYLTTEYTGLYNPIVYCYQNCVTDGLLTAAGGTMPMWNIFEYASGLGYDQEQMQQDIEMYGLYTYEDFAEYMSKEAFDALPYEYLKVAVGKGLLTEEDVIAFVKFTTGALDDNENSITPTDTTTTTQ